MEIKTAVCLLTCGRADLTERTIASFSMHNGGRDDLVLLHAEGGGDREEGLRVANLAGHHGFTTIDWPHVRVPQMASFRVLLAAAIAYGCKYMLWLENDWESVAPAPTVSFLEQYPMVQTWRLYGARKMRSDGPRAMAGTHVIGTTTPIEWAPSTAKGWEFARAHWVGGGSIARSLDLAQFDGLARLKDVIVATADFRSMRPRHNIMFHIGEETTRGLVQ